MILSSLNVGPTTSLIKGVSVMVPVFVCPTTRALRNPGLNVGIFAFPYDSVVSPVVFRSGTTAAWTRAIAKCCGRTRVLTRERVSGRGASGFAFARGVSLEHVVKFQ